MQTPDSATVHCNLPLAAPQIGEFIMGKLTSDGVLRKLEDACKQSMKDLFGDSTAFTVEAVAVNNTVAGISIGGSFEVMEKLARKMGYNVEHSISVSFTVDNEDEIKLITEGGKVN